MRRLRLLIAAVSTGHIFRLVSLIALINLFIRSIALSSVLGPAYAGPALVSIIACLMTLGLGGSGDVVFVFFMNWYVSPFLVASLSAEYAKSKPKSKSVHFPTRDIIFAIKWQ